MGLSNKLTRVSDGLRKLLFSRGRDSYFRYKLGRDYERKRAERERKDAMDSAERKHESAERQQKYEERYAGEREQDIARERAERADDN